MITKYSVMSVLMASMAVAGCKKARMTAVRPGGSPSAASYSSPATPDPVITQTQTPTQTLAPTVSEINPSEPQVVAPPPAKVVTTQGTEPVDPPVVVATSTKVTTITTPKKQTIYAQTPATAPIPEARPIRTATATVTSTGADAPASADRLHCRWDRQFRPSTYLEYNPSTHKLIIKSGWHGYNTAGKWIDKGPDCPTQTRNGEVVQGIDAPQCRDNDPKKCSRPQDYSGPCMRVYDDVTVVRGLKPYLDKGFTLVGFGGDVPIASMLLTYNAPGYDDAKLFPYEAYWNDHRVPGDPDKEGISMFFKTKGYCWTDQVQGKEKLGR